MSLFHYGYIVELIAIAFYFSISILVFLGTLVPLMSREGMGSEFLRLGRTYSSEVLKCSNFWTKVGT